MPKAEAWNRDVPKSRCYKQSGKLFFLIDDKTGTRTWGCDVRKKNGTPRRSTYMRGLDCATLDVQGVELPKEEILKQVDF